MARSKPTPRGRALVFVDTLPATEEAKRRYPRARLVSDNPLLVHDPRSAGAIEDISPLLPQKDATELGHAAIDMLKKLDQSLEDSGAAERFGGRPAPLNLTVAMRSLLVTLMQRGAVLARSLKVHGAGPLVLMVVDQPRWADRAPWALNWFVCPHRALAEHGFFGRRSIQTKLFDMKLPNQLQQINDATSGDNLLRAALVPPAMLAHEIKRRLGFSRLAWRRGIAVGKPCESLRETLPWLAARGYRFHSVLPPGYAPTPAPDFARKPRQDKWLAARARPILLDGLDRTRSFTKTQAGAIADVFIDHLSAGMMGLGASVAALDDALDRGFDGVGGPKTLLTGGVYGPIGAQTHAACRAHGISLVDFEHGATTGIAHTSERRLDHSEASTCDVLMASTARARTSFAKARSIRKPEIHVIGLADQTRRIFWPTAQRWRARKRLALGRRDTAVFHVSTLLYGGNQRPGDDSAADCYVFETEHRLLTESYADLDKRVFYKPYPTRRFAHHARYDELFALPDNVRLLEWEDFRYLRAAADIIVTSANSSTIGWCAGAGVPLVHLGSKIVHALVDDGLRRDFAEAFFCIDMDRADWSARLRALLSREIDDLRAEWNSKKPARETLLESSILGPPGSVGRRAARLIAGLHG